MRRGLNLKWQCLSRVDALDLETASRMKRAGCQRIYFGIESGDETTLRIMRKETDLRTARTAVSNARSAQNQTGAFFIIGYPGESNQAILNTIRFGASLPLDYLSFTLPYPIPGTGLYEKVKDNLKDSVKRRPRLIDHNLLFKSQFSELKLKFAIAKGAVQFMMRKHLCSRGYRLLGTPLEKITDELFRAMK
jgi:anaerobic magnesium-protoporphyrin IX monomethyl ester cyclase